MPKLYDWFITMHPMKAKHILKWEEREYLGKRDFFFAGHGNVIGSPKFWEGEFIHTSAIKWLEYIEGDELLRIHTQNSIYDCALRNCSFRQQEPLAELPFSLEEYAEKYKFGDWGEPERDSILLVFADYKGYGLVDALVDLKGEIFHLDENVHLGMFQDSVLLQDFHKAKVKRLRNIDIRFFPPANFFSNLIKFYQFNSAGLPVYLHNAGGKMILFDTQVGRLEVGGGIRKLVSAENAVNSDGTWYDGAGFLYR